MNLKRNAIAVVCAGLAGLVVGCPEIKPQVQPSILYAAADMGVVTSGTNYAGEAVQGTVTISTQVRLAEKVQVVAVTEAGTEVIATQDCSDGCVDDLTFTHQPTVDTTYLVQALRGEGRCDKDPDITVTEMPVVLYPEECDEALAGEVTVVPPALLTLGSDPMNNSVEVNAGANVEVPYTVDAENWAIGVIVDDGMGGMDFVPCLLKSAFDDPEVTDPKICWLPEATDMNGDPTGEPETEGNATFPDVQESYTVTGLADNGADDELDAVPLGAVTFTINVNQLPQVVSFEADDTTITSGSTVTLTWETTGDSVAITSDAMAPNQVTGLDQCTDATGTCDVTVTADTSSGTVTITLTLTATNANGDSAPATLVLMVGDAPNIADFSANPAAIAADGSSTLSWTTNADSVTINDGSADIVVSGMTTCDSGNPCEPAMDSYTVMNIQADTTFTLTATNDYGEATAQATVDVQGAPMITALDVGGDDVLADDLAAVTADEAALNWTVTDGTTIAVQTAPAAAAPTAGDCSTVTMWNPGPSVTFALTGSVTLPSLTADTCVSFEVSGPGGMASQVFKIERHPNFVSLTVDGSDALAGGTFQVAAGNTSATIAWVGGGADDSELYTAPLGGAADCASVGAANFTGSGAVGAADGSGTVTPAANGTCAFVRLTNSENGSSLDSPFILITP